MDTALNLERCGLKEEEADGLLAYLQHTNHTVRPRPATRAILALSRLKSESRGKCGALGADRPDVGGRKPGAEGLATTKETGFALGEVPDANFAARAASASASGTTSAQETLDEPATKR